MTRVLHSHNTKNKFNIWLSTHIAIPYTRILYSAVVNALEPTENHRVKSALIIIDFFANKTLRRRSLINTLSLQIRLFVVNLFDGLWHVYVYVCYVLAVRVCHHRVPPFMIALSLFYVHTTAAVYVRYPNKVYKTMRVRVRLRHRPATVTITKTSTITIIITTNSMSIPTCVKSIVLNFTFMFSFTQRPNI